MAQIGMAQAARREQFNGLLGNVFKMLQEKGLLEEQQKGRMDYLGESQRGNEALEMLRTQNDLGIEGYKSGLAREEEAGKHANKLAEIYDNMVSNLSVHPKIQQLVGQIMWNKTHNMPTDELDAEYRGTVNGLVGTFYKMGRGTTELTEDEARSVVSLGGPVAAQLMNEVSRTWNAKEERAQVSVPNARANVMRAGTEAATAGGVTPNQRIERHLKTVQKMKETLLQQGVYMDMITDSYGMDVTAKYLANHSPLDARYRGAALALLTSIENNLNNGILPSPEEQKIVENLNRTSEIMGITKEGETANPQGLPTRETGGQLPADFLRNNKAGVAGRTTGFGPGIALPGTPDTGQVRDEWGHYINEKIPGTNPKTGQPATFIYIGNGKVKLEVGSQIR